MKLGYLYGGKIRGDVDLGATDPYTGEPCKAYVSGHVRTPLSKHVPTSAPASPAAGDVYYDSVLKKLRVHNGTDWETITSA